MQAAAQGVGNVLQAAKLEAGKEVQTRASIQMVRSPSFPDSFPTGCVLVLNIASHRDIYSETRSPPPRIARPLPLCSFRISFAALTLSLQVQLVFPSPRTVNIPPLAPTRLPLLGFGPLWASVDEFWSKRSKGFNSGASSTRDEASQSFSNNGIIVLAVVWMVGGALFHYFRFSDASAGERSLLLSSLLFSLPAHSHLTAAHLVRTCRPLLPCRPVTCHRVLDALLVALSRLRCPFRGEMAPSLRFTFERKSIAVAYSSYYDWAWHRFNARNSRTK
jgi:hypothetical protein